MRDLFGRQWMARSGLSLVFLALAADLGIAAKPSGGITGIVSAASAGTPLAGATVAAYQTGLTIKQSVTDSTGAYTMTGLAAGSYDVSASKAGYSTQTVSGVTVANRSTSTVNFSLVSTGGAINGTVRDSTTSSPLPSATVRARQAGTVKATATSDAGGRYSLSPLSSGSYDLDASAVGYVPGIAAGQTVVAGETTTVDFQMSADTSPPTAPSGLTASAEDSSRIRLSWTAAADDVGIASYSILRNGARVATASGLEYIDSGLSPSTSYCYTVTATDGRGNESSASNSACSTTLAGPRTLTIPLRDLNSTTQYRSWASYNSAIDNTDGTYATTSDKGALLSCYCRYTLPNYGSIRKVEVGVRHRADVADGNDGLTATPWLGSTQGRTSGVLPAATAPKTDWFDITADPSGPGAAGWTWANLSGLAVDIRTAVAGKRGIGSWMLDQVYLKVTYLGAAEPSSSPTITQVLSNTVWVGGQLQNVFDVVWAAPETAWDVVTYNVYNNGIKVGAVPSATTAFRILGISDDSYNTLVVGAVDSQGRESRSAPKIVKWGARVPTISISHPRQGQPLASDVVTVVGTVSANTVKVLVGGVLARVSSGILHARVPVGPGAVSLTATAYNSDGQTSVQTVSFLFTPIPSPLALNASNPSGPPPLTVSFSSALLSGLAIAKYEWDLDGDGAFELTTTEPQQPSHTYADVRTYCVSLRATDAAGAVHSAELPVFVHLPPVPAGNFSGHAARGVAADAAGNVYVADGALGRVAVYDAIGRFLRSFGSAGTGPGELLDASAIALDDTGAAYVADSGNRRVQKFDSLGGYVQAIGAGMLSSPAGLAVRDGELFVADSEANRIVKFGTDGAFIASIGADTGEAALSAPAGVALGGSGALYVADTGHDRVARFTASGEYLGALGSSGSGPGQLSAPAGVWWDEINRRLAVADAGNGRVLLLDTEGHQQAVLIGAEFGFGTPSGVCTTTDGTTDSLLVASGEVSKLGLPVLSPAQVWDQMKTRLLAGDVPGALSFFGLRSREQYRELFAYFSSPGELAAIAAGMGPIAAEYILGDVARYRIDRQETSGGQTTTVPHYIFFDKNEDGVWQIRDF